MKLFNFIIGFLSASFLFLGVVRAEGANGQILVRGQAGPSQLFAQVKAVRCEFDKRACSEAVYFSLNQPMDIPAGKYILGFENSIYPGWVDVQVGQQTVLDLVKIMVSTSLKSATQVKIYRDFTSSVEQNKELFVQYNLGRHFFRQASYDFGDLYLTSQIQNDVTQRLTYEACKSLKYYGEVSPDAQGICDQIQQASNPEELTSLFVFQNNSTVIQNWVTVPGDRIKILLKKQLVSAPVKGTDFVSVFPGQYRMIVDSKKMNSIPVTAGTIVENY